jgi:hypothetical protein
VDSNYAFGLPYIADREPTELGNRNLGGDVLVLFEFKIEAALLNIYSKIRQHLEEEVMVQSPPQQIQVESDIPWAPLMPVEHGVHRQKLASNA